METTEMTIQPSMSTATVTLRHNKDKEYFVRRRSSKDTVGYSTFSN